MSQPTLEQLVLLGRDGSLISLQALLLSCTSMYVNTQPQSLVIFF